MPPPLFNLKYRSSKSPLYPLAIRKRKACYLTSNPSSPSFKKGVPWMLQCNFFSEIPMLLPQFHYHLLKLLLPLWRLLEKPPTITRATSSWVSSCLNRSNAWMGQILERASREGVSLSSHTWMVTKPRISRVTTPSKAPFPSPKITGVCASPCGKISIQKTFASPRHHPQGRMYAPSSFSDFLPP